MIEELRQVDDSVLTSLVDLRRERDALRQRLARMQESASQVSAKVLERVRRDYETRIAALEGKALPLKDAALATFGRLKPLHDAAEDACTTLQLDQEEIDLRHSLGEFDDAEHRDRTARLAETLHAARERADAIADYLTRFAAAFDSPDELEPAGTSQFDLPAATPLPEAETVDPAIPAPALATPFGEPRDDDGTLMLPPEAPAPTEPPSAVPRSPPRPADPAGCAGRAGRAGRSLQRACGPAGFEQQGDPARAGTESPPRGARQRPRSAGLRARTADLHRPHAGEPDPDLQARGLPPARPDHRVRRRLDAARPLLRERHLRQRPAGYRAPARRRRPDPVRHLEIRPAPHDLRPGRTCPRAKPPSSLLPPRRPAG